MKTMDDHYRKIAEANRSGRRMLDVTVNNPDEFRSRTYGAHRQNARDGLAGGKASISEINEGSTNQMSATLARRNISCPECGAEPSQNCVSYAATTKGRAMENTVHNKRFSMAKRIYARKSAED
jgi:predicted transcriptional regulator